MGSSKKSGSSEDWGGDRAGGPAPTPTPPHPSFAGSWRSASGRALSATRRRCARCCRCASAAGRVLRARPLPPRPTPRPPRGPCSAWCRGRPGKPTGRCRCWRASNRLSLASRGVCPAKAASEDPAPSWRPSASRPVPFGDCLRLPRPSGQAQSLWEPRGGLIPAPAPLPALLVCVRSQRVLHLCVWLCLGRPAAATWCLSPWAGGGCPRPPPPIKGGGSGSGWVGWLDGPGGY